MSTSDGSEPGPMLVAGTDPDAIEFLSATINRAGFACRPAASGDAAGELLRSDPAIQLILVDADLEVVRSIRALADPDLAAITIVVLGASGAPASAATEAREAGATHWVERPVAEATLLNGIRHLLAR